MPGTHTTTERDQDRVEEPAGVPEGPTDPGDPGDPGDPSDPGDPGDPDDGGSDLDPNPDGGDAPGDPPVPDAQRRERRMEDMLERMVRIFEANASQSGSGDADGKSNLQKPSVFDGSKPKRFRDWIIELSMHFAECPKYFASGERKVMYAYSFTGGVVRQYFAPDYMAVIQ
ncbi:hypothetical protein HDZ31DRAFT_78554, partial [Schizophyllum fasciatum]